MTDWEVTLNFWTYIALLILALLFIYKIVKISKELKDLKGKVDYIIEVPVLENSNGYIRKKYEFIGDECYYKTVKNGKVYKFEIDVPYHKIRSYTFRDNILKILAVDSFGTEHREYKFVLNYDCSIATLINQKPEF